MVNSDHPYQQQHHQQNPYGHPYPNNNSHSQQNSHSLYYASNGNYAAVSTGRAATSTPSNNGSDSALVSIDGAEATTVTSQVLTSNNLHAMGSQNVAYNHSHHNSNPQPRANLFRRFPLRSILKNGKVHNSSQATTTGEEGGGPSVPLSQPKSGILKKATTAEAFITIGNGSVPSAAVQQQQHNGGNPANSSSTSSNHPPPPLPILQVSPSSASSHASAKSAASLVQFAGSPSQPELPQQRKENSVSAHSFFLFVRILFSFA